jgi:hypothetical protein
MEDLGWKAEAGVKLRSPKGRAAARGLDARIPLPTHFHASGRHFTQIISTQSKIPLDSDHGIYRVVSPLAAPHESEFGPTQTFRSVRSYAGCSG